MLTPPPTPPSSLPLSPAQVLLVPGLGSSGPDHWQTHWEARYGYRRIEQRSWDRPERVAWVAAIDAAVHEAPAAPLALVAHSLGCAAVAHWAREAAATGAAAKIAGALLVAPADVDSPAHTPAETRGFAPMPLERLPFPALVITSETDAYVAPERARTFARRWGADLVSIGDAGHINAASALGDWQNGHRLLERLLCRA